MQRRQNRRCRVKACLLLLVLVLASALRVAAQPNSFESNAALAPSNKIDGLVFAKLRELNIQPANVCSDPVFVRRVYLDTIGTLPTAVEAENFILDRTRTSAPR